MRFFVKKISVLAVVILLLLTFTTSCASRGLSPAGESSLEEQKKEEEIRVLDANPLTGAQKGDGYVDGQRPVAVMVNNLKEALPQSGLEAASVIYEMVTEGGVTRLMALYNTTAELGRVGPVRSTRDQFVQFVLPDNAVLLHFGTSIYASDMLHANGYATVDGIYLGTLAFSFDAARAATRANEHCFYTDAALADAGVAQQGISTTGTVEPLFRFLPYTDAPRTPAGGAAGSFSFQFSGYTDAAFQYNADTHTYYKSEFGDPQMDESTGGQLNFTNVLVLACPVGLKSDGLCTDFDFTSGSGWYFSEGMWENVTWKKGAPTEQLQLFDAAGKPLYLNVGKTYLGFANTPALNRTLMIDGVAVVSVTAAADGISSLGTSAG